MCAGQRQRSDRTPHPSSEDGTAYATRSDTHCRGTCWGVPRLARKGSLPGYGSAAIGQAELFGSAASRYHLEDARTRLIKSADSIGFAICRSVAAVCWGWLVGRGSGRADSIRESQDHRDSWNEGTLVAGERPFPTFRTA